MGDGTTTKKKGSEALPSRRSLGENGTAADRDAQAAVGLLPRRRRQRERCIYATCPGRGCPAGFVTSCELRESVATYVLLRSGEHERVNERNPSKASAKAPAFIYSGVILLYQLQKNALLHVPASGCERTSACVHRFSL